MEPENEPRGWRPTNRQALWAVGMVVALATMALLIVNLVDLDPGMWENLSKEQKERMATFMGIAAALTAIIVLLAVGGASLGWTGFGDKVLWDWLQLLSTLAIPVVLAAASLWFTAHQEERQQRVESERAKLERDLEEQRSQDTVLQAYLDQMSQLMLERNLRNSDEGSEVRTLARARTLTVLGRLDSDRRRNLLRFLYEAKLIDKESPVLDLAEANFAAMDLSGMSLSNANLDGANLAGSNLTTARLEGADLSGASLQGAELEFTSLGKADLTDAVFSTKDVAAPEGISGQAFRHLEEVQVADLSGADLTGANLEHALLTGVDMSPTSYQQVPTLLSGANLSGAILSDANLEEANVNGTNLEDADLSGANLEDVDLSDANPEGIDLSGANLEDVNLSGANLSGVDLDHANLEDASLRHANLRDAFMEGADLSDADLSSTDLSGANLNDTDLEDANLEDAKGRSKKEIELQARSLEGATMPDGSKYD